VVAVEVVKRNTCTLAIGAIAALAGVSETTVRRALRQARLLALVTIQERRLSRFRNETNVVSIISGSWSSWLRLGPAGGGCQFRKGTNTSEIRRARQRPAKPAQRAAERANRALVEPGRLSRSGRDRG
jgi:hypothetical protein